MNQKILMAKQKTVESLAKRIEESKSIVVVEYRGLSVKELSELRKSLKEVNASLGVFKNTLFLRAVRTANIAGLDDYLTGSNAYIFSSEVTSAPKILAKFARRNPKLVLKAGLIEGQTCDEAKLKEIAKLPDKNGMISMLLSCLQAPIRKFACTVKAVADQKSQN